VNLQLAFGVPLDEVVAHLARSLLFLPKTDVASPGHLVYLDGVLLLLAEAYCHSRRAS
jgi:hypothetical protein